MDSELSPGFFVDFDGKMEFVFCFGGLLNFQSCRISFYIGKHASQMADLFGTPSYTP